jgi:hypothetical protein
LDDLHLQCEGPDGLERRFDSLEAAQERFEELLNRGDLIGKPWDCEAFWQLNAPPELHEKPVRDPRLFESHPATYAAQESALSEFEARRAEWLEWNGHS